MTIIFDDQHYFSAVWFVGHNKAEPLEDRMDWLAALWRAIAPGSPWVLQYRFRLHRAASPHAEEDVKSWYRAMMESHAPDAETTARDAVHLIATLTAHKNNTTVDYTPLGCAGAEAIRRLLTMQKPWMHLAPEHAP